MAETFDDVWWTVDLPPNWSGQRGQDCVTFLSDANLGALQISCARKEIGFVSQEDLMEFATARVPSGTPVREFGSSLFSGVVAEYTKDHRYWMEWWLKAGQLMVYATYNTAEGSEEREKGDVQSIVAALKPRFPPAGLQGKRDNSSPLM